MEGDDGAEGFSRERVIQDSTDPREAKVFRAHAAPQGTCENLIEQKDGDSPVETIVTGLWVRSRSTTVDGLRKFISEDNHEAVKVGDLHRETMSKKVVKPKFTSPGAVIEEGADEVILRSHEEGVLRTFIDTSFVGDHRWERPLADADWHAFSQAIFQGVEESGRPCITTARTCTKR